MRSLFAAFAVALWLFSTPVSQAAEPPLTLFPTKQQAQTHCPSDVVVWLNTASGVYHMQGQRWYGNTKRGAYVCKHEADASGARPSKSGQ